MCNMILMPRIMAAKFLRLTILGTFAVVLTGCEPKANLAIVQSGTNITFQVATKNVRELLSLRVWKRNTKETLWDISLSCRPDATFDYGSVPELPNPWGNFATQRFPLHNERPRSPPPQSDFAIELTCQYDKWFGACMKDFYFSFVTDQNGRVSQVRKLENFPLEDRPPPTPYP
jgi:hypothetical protein